MKIRCWILYSLWCIFSSQALPTYLNYLRLVVDRLTLVLITLDLQSFGHQLHLEFLVFYGNARFQKHSATLLLDYVIAALLTYFILLQHKEMYLVHLLNELAGNSFIIFATTCMATVRLSLMLRCLGKLLSIFLLSYYLPMFLIIFKIKRIRLLLNWH